MDNIIGPELNRELLQWFAANPPKDSSVCAGNLGIVLSTAQNSRSENQDRAVKIQFTSRFPERSFKLLAVFDGIGGMLDGGKCAELSIASLVSNLVTLPRSKSRVSLIQALFVTNHDVWEAYRGRGGTTFAGLFIENGRARAINIGDSRIYRFAPNRGLLQQSTDDRIGNQIAKMKGLEGVEINPEFADRLGQYVGMQEPISPNVFQIDSSAMKDTETIFLLSTDGAHYCGNTLIEETLRKNNTPLKIANELIKFSANNSNADNATIICANAPSIAFSESHVSSFFEHLQIWSINGIFDFYFPSEIVDASQGKPKKNTHSIGTKNKSAQNRKRDKPQTRNDLEHPTPPATPTSEDETAKKKVIIEQMTFDPISDNEPPR